MSSTTQIITKKSLNIQQQHLKNLFASTSDLCGEISLSSKVSSDESTSFNNLQTTMCFAINAFERTICIISYAVQQSLPNKYILLETIANKMFKKFGQKLNDSEVDEQNDDYTHCGECECFYRLCCLEHPFYRVLDRKPIKQLNFDGSSVLLTRALETLPNYLLVSVSSIPNAGRGVFTKVFI